MIDGILDSLVVLGLMLAILFICYLVGRLFVLYKNHKRPFWARRAEWKT